MLHFQLLLLHLEFTNSWTFCSCYVPCNQAKRWMPQWRAHWKNCMEWKRYQYEFPTPCPQGLSKHSIQQISKFHLATVLVQQRSFVLAPSIQSYGQLFRKSSSWQGRGANKQTCYEHIFSLKKGKYLIIFLRIMHMHLPPHIHQCPMIALQYEESRQVDWRMLWLQRMMQQRG